MRFGLSTLAVLVGGATATAAVKTEMIDYKHGDVRLEGYLAYDDAVAGKRPGILVCHEWWGHNDYARKRAEQLAALGYVAFALDMYGEGVLAKDAKEAGEKAAVFKKDVSLMRARAMAGLDILRRQPQVDAENLAAIGYCFGGTTALELARAGADLKGVVSFHGGLDTPDRSDAKRIRGKILVLTGADDPVVPKEQVAAFEEEMKNAKIDYRIVSYPGAVHGFTNPANGDDPKKGVAYNKDADEKSWEEMKAFFGKVFTKK
ncbi:MAG TPA: dienelactone hydrolase family protein [Gemmataceae bacterium]|nr:dienelactone hydrolase family protein [Gemmataceae bacterium]